MELPIICDRTTAGFSCVSYKVNARMSRQSFEGGGKQVRRNEEVLISQERISVYNSRDSHSMP